MENFICTLSLLPSTEGYISPYYLGSIRLLAMRLMRALPSGIPSGKRLYLTIQPLVMTLYITVQCCVFSSLCFCFLEEFLEKEKAEGIRYLPSLQIQFIYTLFTASCRM